MLIDANLECSVLKRPGAGLHLPELGEEFGVNRTGGRRLTHANAHLVFVHCGDMQKTTHFGKGRERASEVVVINDIERAIVVDGEMERLDDKVVQGLEI